MENLKLTFSDEGIRRLAELAFEVNERVENIGARRLHTLLERLLETLSFDADSKAGSEVTLDAASVNAALAELAQDQDLSQYIL